MSVNKLQEIDGIGPAKAELLASKGVKSPEELSVMDPEELKIHLECSLAVAKKVIKSAKDLTREVVKLVDGQDYQDERDRTIQYISTGSASLDGMFLGKKGVPTDSITAFYGVFSSGKTQLCKELALNMKKQYGRKTVWIETEPNTLVLTRLLEIAKVKGIDYNLKTDIIAVPAKFMETPTHQFKAYEGIEEKIKAGMDIGLIVVDSFNALFRSTYTGRETLPNRSAESGRHIGYLQRLASKYNIAVVLTLQCMGVPDSGASLGSLKKYGINTPPVTSNVVKHGVNYMIGLEQISSTDRSWKAVIADGPVARNDTMFCITENGITEFFDTGKKK